MVQNLSHGKSVCILAVVVGCFAILWPSIFYPMLKSSLFPTGNNGNGCCHVLLDKDFNGVKLVLDLCNAVLKKSENFDLVFNKLDNKAIMRCRSQINNTCGVDIQPLLKDRIRLDSGYKFILDQLRVVNQSFCLKYHFDINLDILGAPHRLKTLDFISSKYNRQERSPHLKPDAIHPALRERGRAIPQPSIQTKSPREQSSPPPPIIAAKRPPIPGMRPPMGGTGHVPSQKGSGAMGILMPLYTVGIVIFFVYTISKLICKKQDNTTKYIRDPDFNRHVFQNKAKEAKESKNGKSNGSIATDTSKLGWEENDIRDVEINRLRKRLAETEATMELIVKQMNLVSRSLPNPLNENCGSDENKFEKPASEPFEEEPTTTVGEEENKSSTKCESETINGLIKVVGTETKEHCENGQPWKPSSGAIPPTKISAPNGKCIEEIGNDIILPASVPANSQILVSDTVTKNVADEPSVILESKVTLNVISSNLQNQNEVDEDVYQDDTLNNDEDEEFSEEEEVREDESKEKKKQDSFEKEGIPSTEL